MINLNEVERIKPEQQLAQQALTIFVSKSSSLLSSSLLPTGCMNESTYTDLARLIFNLTQKMKREVDKHQSINGLHVPIGMRESGQKRAYLSMVIEALRSLDQSQTIISDGTTTVATPSIIPGLFVLHEQRMNGGPTQRLHSYFLVGRHHLPKGYQYPYPEK